VRQPFIVKHTKRNIVLAALLALLCIGIAELTACRYFEPEIYEAIVSPVRYAAGVAVDTGKAGLNAAAQFCRDTADAAGQLCRDAADGLSRFAAETAARWAEFTAPDIPSKYRPPGQEGPGAVGEPSIPTLPPITELRREGGREVLTGGAVDIVYYCQSAAEWADQPYGTDTIGPYGCGPTVMAMAVASLTLGCGPGGWPASPTSPPTRCPWRPGRCPTATGPGRAAPVTPLSRARRRASALRPNPLPPGRRRTWWTP